MYVFYEDCIGLPVATIRQQRFRPFGQHQPDLSIISDHSVIITWLSFQIQNISQSQTAEVLFNAGRQGIIDLYSIRGIRLQRTGTYLIPYNLRQWQPIRLRVPPRQTSTYYLKITNLVRVVDPIVATLHTPASLKMWFADYMYLNRWLTLGLLGLVVGLLFMSLFAFSQYAFNRDRVFLYYAIFCLLGSFFVVWNTNYRLGLGLPLQVHSITANLGSTLTIVYILFIARLIDLPVRFPKTWMSLQCLVAVLVVQEVVHTYEYFYGLLFSVNWPYKHHNATFVLAGLLLFVSTFRSDSPFRQYLLGGMVCLLVTGFFSAFINQRLETGDAVQQIRVNFTPFLYGLGFLSENFFFLMALAYRNRLIEVEKNQIQQQYTHPLTPKSTRNSPPFHPC